MRWIDGFRNRDAAAALSREIESAAHDLPKKVSLMEVCGSHTMAIARFGIREFLPGNVRLISGPGCPVCVTDASYIDHAIELAERGVIVCTFGDMLRVPGSRRTNLAEARARGGDVRICYSPEDAATIAQQSPEKQVVFLAIGFETTVAPVISLIPRAVADHLDNLSLLVAFKLVPPALSALLADPEVNVDGFLCPAHVSAIIGSEAYRPFVEKNGVPCVVAGFEPLDILYGVLSLVRQLRDGAPVLDNQYNRVVKPHGNQAALALIDKYLQPVDVAWREIGVLPRSGLGLRAEYRAFDASERFSLSFASAPTTPTRCRCGDVLKGKIGPSECELFGRACVPDRPIGPCMVSAEGSCAAEYKYSALAQRAGAA